MNVIEPLSIFSRSRQLRVPRIMFGIGVALISAAGTIYGLIPLEAGILYWIKTVVTFIFLLLGVSITIASFVIFSFIFLRAVTYYDSWNIKRVDLDISKWQPLDDGEEKSYCISILQTFCPENSNFSAIKQKLIQSNNKIYRLRFLLIDPDSEVLKARMYCRNEDIEYAQLAISLTVDSILKMKAEIEEYWRNIGSERKLDIQVRYYTACPFGPLFILGKYALWTGFYISHDSSDSAPMLRLANPDSIDWVVLEESFEKIWMSDTTRKVKV